MKCSSKGNNPVPTVHTGIPVDTDTHAPDDAGRTALERYELRPVR